MADLHNILFNMQTLYSFILGVYAVYLAAQNKPLSGNFWGSVAIYVILNIVIVLIGIFLALGGLKIASDGRSLIYFLYMAFLIVIMPGLFSMQRGREDRQAAIAFAALALFNASVSFSMMQRGLASWVLIQTP